MKVACLVKQLGSRPVGWCAATLAFDADERADLPRDFCDAYEGDWKVLPNFDELKPKKSTAVPGFTLDGRTRDEAFGLRFRGYLRVPRRGVYKFYLASDDGSKLYIGKQEVVDNDGIHPVMERSGWIALGAGMHPITVTYWDTAGDQSLQVSYFGPGIAKQPVPAAVLFRRKR